MIILCDNDYCGLYASKEYNIGKIIHRLLGDIVEEPTRTSIQITKNIHIEDERAKYMNHSFNPNCEIMGRDIIALNHIIEMEELTFNYNTTENKLSFPFIDNITNEAVLGNKL
jgi:hypothetical protein